MPLPQRPGGQKGHALRGQLAKGRVSDLKHPHVFDRGDRKTLPEVAGIPRSLMSIASGVDPLTSYRSYRIVWFYDTILYLIWNHGLEYACHAKQQSAMKT
jgi:hypothetical protein